MSFIRQAGPNFKPEKPVRGTAAAKAHMAKVAQLRCVTCGDWPVEIHHVICGRFGQHKASDMDVIPLCPCCHRTGPLAIHRGKETWVQAYGPDYGYLPVVAALLDPNNEIDF